MEFKNGYNFMYQKLKKIYASKTGRPAAEDSSIDFGMTEEEIANIKLVYETKEGFVANFTGIPTVEDKPFDVTANGELVIGPSEPGPTPSKLNKLIVGDKFINLHFNTSLEPTKDDFVLMPMEEGQIYGMGPAWYWYYDDETSYFNDGLFFMMMPAGTYIEDLDITLDRDCIMVALPEGGIPIYVNAGILEFYDIIRQKVPGYPVPPYLDINIATPGWQGATIKEAMETIVKNIGDAPDYQSAKHHCERYLIEGAYGKVSGDTEIGGVYDAPWNGKLAGFTEEDYKPVNLKRVAVGDTINCYRLSKNDAIINCLKDLDYRQDYPRSSNNTYLLSGVTAGVAPVATVNSGNVVFPGGASTALQSDDPLLVATKSTKFSNMIMMILPMLVGRKVYFDTTCTPNFITKNLNWATYGSEEDEFANSTGYNDSGRSFVKYNISETACSMSEAISLVAFRHNTGSDYTYKLYASQYANAHDPSGNISGTLLYDNGVWVNSVIDAGADTYLGLCDFDDYMDLMDAVSVTKFDGIDKYVIYQGGPVDMGDIFMLNALYHSSGEQLSFLCGMANGSDLCLSLYDEDGWIKGYVAVELGMQSQTEPFIFKSYIPYSATNSSIDCANTSIKTLTDLPVYTEE